MGDLHMLTTGAVSPVVATIFAALGALLSILLLTRARQRTGWRRVRLVTYAIPALAGPTIFLPALVTVLAMRVDGSVLLLAPTPLGYSLAAATGGTALALVMVCFGRPGFVRQVLAGVLLVGAIGGTGTFLAASLTTGLPIGFRTLPTGVALALACVTGFGLATALAATRTLRRALGTATLLGLSLATVYHVAAAGLTLRPVPGGPIPASEVTGLSPQQVGLPAVAVIAVVLTFIWYFTLGTATLRDLHRTFAPEAGSEDIDPWMVEQVRRRVAHTSTADGPVPGWPAEWPGDGAAVTIHAVAVAGRDIANAIAHRARAALPAGPIRVPLPAAPGASGARSVVTAPAVHPVHDHATGPEVLELGEPTGDSGRRDWTGLNVTRPTATGSHMTGTNVTGANATGIADSIDSDEWPGGRNEPAAARLAKMWSSNSRYGSGPADAADRSDPFGDADPDAWAERLTAARAAVAAEARAPRIVYDFRAGSSLPQRNAHPIHRP